MPDVAVPGGDVWRLGRRYTGGVTWAVQCWLCDALAFEFDTKREAARWLVDHRARFHSLETG